MRSVRNTCAQATREPACLKIWLNGLRMFWAKSSHYTEAEFEASRRIADVCRSVAVAVVESKSLPRVVNGENSRCSGTSPFDEEVSD